MPDANQLKFLKRIATGRLGMVGAEVGVYIFKKGLGKQRRHWEEEIKETEKPKVLKSRNKTFKLSGVKYPFTVSLK